MTQEIKTEELFDEELVEEKSNDSDKMYKEEEKPKASNSDLKTMKDSVKLDEKEVKKTLEEVQIEVGLTDEDKKVIQLYQEFDSFLQKTIKLVPDDSEQKMVIPTGIDVLDAILGGGFAVGAMSMILGTPGSGKSMLVGQVLANAQKMIQDSFIGAYLDSEEATTSVRLWNLGVRNPKIIPKTDVTVEKVFKVIEGTCMFKDHKNIVGVPSVVIWDSIANTASQREREADDLNSVIGYKARLLSFLLPSYIAKCSKYNICFLAINQLRDKVSIGPMAPANDMKFLTYGKDIPGGNALKYNAFQLLEMKIAAVLKEEAFGFSGIAVNAKCVKNKLFSPNIVITLIGNFVTGFDNFWTNVEFLKSTKRLNQGGGWFYLTKRPDPKFRISQIKSMYNEKPDFKEIFDQEVKDAIRIELVEKYGVQE
jgi:RecA/RadA recombinase